MTTIRPPTTEFHLTRLPWSEGLASLHGKAIQQRIRTHREQKRCHVQTHRLMDTPLMRDAIPEANPDFYDSRKARLPGLFQSGRNGKSMSGDVTNEVLLSKKRHLLAGQPYNPHSEWTALRVNCSDAACWPCLHQCHVQSETKQAEMPRDPLLM
jgi:hypothetical protein